MPPKPTSSKPTLSQLQKIRDRLLAERERLKVELKENCPEVYQWLTEHKIDLNHLSKYSKNFAVAVALTNQMVTTDPAIALTLEPPPAPVQIDATTATPTPTPASGLMSTGDTVEDQIQTVWKLYQPYIEKSAKEYDVDPKLIFATIMTESEGNPRAYRYEPHLDEGSYGLGQMLYSTAVGLGFTGQPEDLYDPEKNINMIARYHRSTLDTYGPLTPEQLTTAYNAGSPYSRAYPGHIARFREWYYANVS